MVFRAMKRSALALTLMIGAVSAVCPGLPNASYAELATSILPASFSVTTAGLSNLTSDLKPPDSFVHSYRKQLLKLKNQLEVFAAAFPLNSAAAHPQDPLKELEGEADAGYEKVGDFQDLAHSGVNYTKADVEQRLHVILKWKSKFQAKLQQFDYASYLGNATEGTMTIRKKLSKFFWSNHTFQPSAELTAVSNLELLLSQQLESMSTEYMAVEPLPLIENATLHWEFHNVRKYSRAINFVTSSFPCLLVDGVGTDGALSLMADLYDKYGAVNDLWTAWNYEVSHNHSSKAAQAKAALDDGWKKLKLWQRSEDVYTKSILQLRTHVRPAAEGSAVLPPTCTAESAVGSRCSVAQNLVRPTQFEVGLAEVLGNKIQFFVDQPLLAIQNYLLKKVIPVIVGNDGRLYQIDGHHTTYAMQWWKHNVVSKMPPSVARSELLSLPLVAEIKCNWTSKFSSEPEFWSAMKEKNFVLLEKQGKPMNPSQLPATIGELTDNALRSLAGIAEIVSSPCIAKTCVPFAEFKWADHLRGQISAGNMPHWQSITQTDNFTVVAGYVNTQEFQTVVHSTSATKLPGYLQPSQPAPPPPDCPWNATSCNL